MPGTPSGENHSADSQKCGRNASPRAAELVVELVDARLEPAALDREAEIAEPHFHELGVR